MKRLLAFIATAVLMFGSSAAVSWLLARNQMVSAESAEANPEAPAPERARQPVPGPHALAASSAPSPVALRPTQTPAAEETIQLAASLRQRLGQLKEKESRIEARQKYMDLVYQDIRAERNAIEELRKEISEELKKAPKTVPIDSDKAKASASPPSGHKHGNEELLPQPQPEDEGDADKIAKIIASGPPETTARLIKELAAKGKTTLAVKLFADLPDKQAAKVLTSLADPALAAELLERMKDYKGRTGKSPK